MLKRLTMIFALFMWAFAIPIWLPLIILDILGWVLTGKRGTVLSLLDPLIDFTISLAE